ncbi:MAG: DinB family protein [Dehalococcoidia bacterium]
MPTYLHRLIDYHNWANQGLLEFLATLPPETLDATVPGVFGTIRKTLRHLLGSDASYQRHLGSTAVPRDPYPEHPDLAFLQLRASESEARLAALVESLPEPGQMMSLGDGRRAAGTIFTQLLMHGCEHRTQIATVLGAQGIEPPDLDAWAFGIRMRGDDWSPDWGPEPHPRPRFPSPNRP